MDKEIKEKLHIEKVVNTGRLYPMKEACEQTGLAYETLKFGSIINVGVRKEYFLTPTFIIEPVFLTRRCMDSCYAGTGCP